MRGSDPREPLARASAPSQEKAHEARNRYEQKWPPMSICPDHPSPAGDFPSSPRGTPCPSTSPSPAPRDLPVSPRESTRRRSRTSLALAGQGVSHTVSCAGHRESRGCPDGTCPRPVETRGYLARATHGLRGPTHGLRGAIHGLRRVTHEPHGLRGAPPSSEERAADSKGPSADAMGQPRILRGLCPRPLAARPLLRTADLARKKHQHPQRRRHRRHMQICQASLPTRQP